MRLLGFGFEALQFAVDPFSVDGGEVGDDEGVEKLVLAVVWVTVGCGSILLVNREAVASMLSLWLMTLFSMALRWSGVASCWNASVIRFSISINSIALMV